ncbi:hypothetical protein OROMI_022400 [Orobanche minor]
MDNADRVLHRPQGSDSSKSLSTSFCKEARSARKLYLQQKREGISSSSSNVVRIPSNDPLEGNVRSFKIFEDLNINSTDIGYYTLDKDREMMSEVAELVINQPISSSCTLAKQARSARKSILQKKRIGHEPLRVPFRDITSSINNQDHMFSSNITQVSSQLFDETISKDARSSQKYILQHKRKAHSGSSNLPTNLETNASLSTLCGMSSNDEICCINKTTQDHNLTNITNVDISPNKEKIQLRKRVKHDKSTINALRRMIKFDNKACSLDGGNIYNVDISEESHMNLNDVQTITLSNDEYLDLGDPIYNCEYCGAYMWYEERSEKSKNPLYPKFSQCCSKGKIQLPLLKEPPLLLRNLLNGVDPRSKNYINNIRAYNMMFSFTSMGGKVDTSVNKGRGPYVFKIQGANYHRIGSLLPQSGSYPKFSQLYIYDTDNEVTNRINALSRCESKSAGIRMDVVNDLKSMLDAYNPLATSFRMARDRLRENDNLDMRMKLIGTREYNRRMCNLPTAPEVAALIVGDIDDQMDVRDIVESRVGFLKRISELHPSYLPLQYPLLFPYGEDGYMIDIPHRDNDGSCPRTRITVTMREFWAFRTHERDGEAKTIFQSKRLFQQLLVDGYTMVESHRIMFIRNNQKLLRYDNYKNLADAVLRGNAPTTSIGKHFVIPTSFTGGPRYMIQNHQDAMAICKWYGFPDLFITITCNPKWPEISRYLSSVNSNPEDRPDIVCRVFKMKLDVLIKDLKDHGLLGKTQAVIYTVEFQKRGLPHAHILLFLHRDNKIPSPNDVDRIISAEIPSNTDNQKLYEAVKSFMIHGPCGTYNKDSPCMLDGKCTKKFPKKLLNSTTVDDEGYPMYMRRNNENKVVKNGIELDNRFVVPYNDTLLLRYQAHINVEWCNQYKSIKYLFKYINKGSDRVTAKILERDQDNIEANGVDEVKNFYNCRYISPCEAIWRINSFDIHYRTPSVQRLSYHLPGERSIIFEDDDDIQDVINKQGQKRSMFEAWMHCNANYEEARNLTYAEFPTKFVWKPKDRIWLPRKRGIAIGRPYYVPPGAGELYYMSLLLHHKKGPRSHAEIRTIGTIEFPAFKEACYSMGLLDDDKEYIDGIKEASFWGSPHYIRNLFAVLLLANNISRPEYVWENTWQLLGDDILHRQRTLLGISVE